MDVLRTFRLLCLLLTPIIAADFQDTDYCALHCGKEHLACQYKNEFGPRCYPPTSIVDIKEYITLILSLHNYKRNEVASGRLKFEPASQMGEMAWDDELAYLSEIKAKQCRLWEDTCRSTHKFPMPGRNGNYMRWWNSKTYTDEEIIEARVLEWLDQSDYAEKSIIQSYPDKDPEPHVAYFAHAVIESNTRVGCAAVRYLDADEKNIFLLNCFYSRALETNMTLYKTGKPTSECLQGISSTYPSLCGLEEVYAYKPGDIIPPKATKKPDVVRRYPPPPAKPSRRRKHKSPPAEMWSI